MLRQLTCTLLLIVLGLTISAGSAQADQIDSLVHRLDRGDEKARVAAAAALGRIGDARAVPALADALDDRSRLVRAIAAGALGKIGDQRGMPALERALADDDETVRRKARLALAKLRVLKPEPRPAPVVPTAKLYVEVNPMSNRAAKSGRLEKEMRAFVVRELGGETGLTLDPSAAQALDRYIVDGAITKLTSEVRGNLVEVTCEVQLTVSTSDGHIASMVTGGATVQARKKRFSSRLERSMQVEALDHAIRGTRANLIGYLQGRIKRTR